jgi:hypothetical protein
VSTACLGWVPLQGRDAKLGVATVLEMYFPQFGVLDLSFLRRSFDADPMNGVMEELTVTHSGDAAILKGVLARDWPLVIRLLER